jgi:hypothetical protein
MTQIVQFISLDEDDKDLVVSFAIDDLDMGVKSLILHRTLFFEHKLDEAERGVNVSLEGDYLEQEDFNMLKSIKITDDEIWLESTFREYHLDMSRIESSEIEEMKQLLRKQNHDNRFTMLVA